MKERLQSAVHAMESELQGDLADAHLRLFSVLGRGGFGTVYHGAHAELVWRSRLAFCNHEPHSCAFRVVYM
jgi:hypothetical protein